MREPIFKSLASESDMARVFFSGLKIASADLAYLKGSATEQPCLMNVPAQDATALGALLTTPVPLADRLQALQGAVTTSVSAHVNLRRTLRHLPMHAKDSRVSTSNPRGGARAIHQTARLTSDWTEQQVVGNGRFGALVGGNIRSEIIPVSVAGLFVKRREKGEKGGECCLIFLLGKRMSGSLSILRSLLCEGCVTIFSLTRSIQLRRCSLLTSSGRPERT
jgi:hypothetical protein